MIPHLLIVTSVEDLTAERLLTVKLRQLAALALVI